MAISSLKIKGFKKQESERIFLPVGTETKNNQNDRVHLQSERIFLPVGDVRFFRIG